MSRLGMLPELIEELRKLGADMLPDYEDFICNTAY